MKKKKLAICFTILLIVLELIGFVITIKNNHRVDFAYYTEDSNCLSLIASCFTLFYLFQKDVPKPVQILKFMSVVGLSLTFLVVLFILIPMYDFNFKWFLLEGDLLYFHLLCPIVAFISFVFFEEHHFEKKDCLYAGLFTVIYSIILIVLNIIGVVEGPYPFLMVRKQSIFASILWGVLILGISYGIPFGIKKIKDVLNAKV